MDSGAAAAAPQAQSTGGGPCREEAAGEHKFAAPLRGRPGRGGREKEEEAGERWGRGKPIRLGPV